MRSNGEPGEALEVDQNALAPQHYPISEGLHLEYRNSPSLEVAPDRNHPYVVHPEPIPQNKLSKRRAICIGAFTCIVILAVALGCGLGLGGKNNVSRSDSTLPGPNSSTSISNTVPAPSAAPTVALNHGILNDSSLAAVTTFDGNRHLFFQDFNGSIRHTVFVQSANSWSNEADFVITNSKPLKHTPLAAIDVGHFGVDEIHVFFIDVDSFLSAVVYYVTSAATNNPMNSSFATATNSSTLSVSLTSSNWNVTYSEMFLLYEAPNGNITALYGHYSVNTYWFWKNVSDSVYSSFKSSDTWLSPPLGSTFMTESPQALLITFFNSLSLYNASAYPLLAAQLGFRNGSFLGVGDEKAFISPIVSPLGAVTSVNESDMISFSWDALGRGAPEIGNTAFVHNQSLVVIFTVPPNPASPQTSYPFARLACINSTSANAIYFYHQLSSGILAEDAWYYTAGWRYSNINIGAGN